MGGLRLAGDGLMRLPDREERRATQAHDAENLSRVS